jgi:glutamyl/glutaminyl-tRNA synthetase
MNGEYIKKMDIHTLQDLLGTYLRTYAAEFYTTVYTQSVHTAMNLRILGDIQTRMKKFDEYIALTETFYADTVPVRTDLLVNPKMKIDDMQMAKESLEMVHSVLSTCMYDTLDDIKTPLLAHIAQAGKKNGQVLWPARVALSGAEFSPGAFEMAYILGREKSLARIQQVLESI